MDAKPAPAPTGTDAFAAHARLQKLLQLKSKMEQLHADLEYLRLMIRLGTRQP